MVESIQHIKKEPNFLLNIVASVKNISNKKARKFIVSNSVQINGKTIVDPLTWVISNSTVNFEDKKILVEETL